MAWRGPRHRTADEHRSPARASSRLAETGRPLPFAPQSWSTGAADDRGPQGPKGHPRFGPRSRTSRFNTKPDVLHQFWGRRFPTRAGQSAARFSSRTASQTSIDLVTDAKGDEDTLATRFAPTRTGNWGARRSPPSRKQRNFVYTWSIRSSTRRTILVGRDGYDQSPASTHKGHKRSRFQVGRSRTPDGSCSFGPVVYPSASTWRARTVQQSRGRTHLRPTTGKPLGRTGPFMLTNYTKGQASTAESSRFLVRQKPRP